jgi:hypothetical protein
MVSLMTRLDSALPFQRLLDRLRVSVFLSLGSRHDSWRTNRRARSGPWFRGFRRRRALRRVLNGMGGSAADPKAH